MKNFSKIVEKRIINAARAEVFEYTQDYNNRLKWDTFLKKADLLHGATKAGEGVYAYCVSRSGLGMETRYVTYHPSKVTAVKMTKGPFFFHSFAGSWAFNELTATITEVVFTYSFSIRLPFFLVRRFVAQTLRKNVKQRLVDLNNCIDHEEHGEKPLV